MTDSWDERTEAIPGTKGDKSFELELDFDDGAGETAQMARPSVVVFEPTALGLADALVGMGFNVRMGTTGVDVMSLAAEDAPGVVLCAPAPDAERRRLLAAALRLRFPNIPIVYVSTHAAQEDAVLGALREGARAVLAWPLPSAADVMRVLGPYLMHSAAVAGAAVTTSSGASALDSQSETGPSARAPASATSPFERAPRAPLPPPRTIASEMHDPSTAATSKQPRPRTVRPPASAEEADVFDEAATVVTPSMASNAPVASPVPQTGAFGAAGARVPSGGATSALGNAPGNAPRNAPGNAPGNNAPGNAPANARGNKHEERGARGDVPLRIPGFADEPTTQPNMRPAAAAVQEALAEKRGEIGDLLAAVSPFLWSLEDASRWAGQLGANGDPVAQSHARTLTLLAKILAQLQARIDETGI